MKDKMLQRKYRLKNRKAFDATYKNRRVLSDSLFTIYLGREKKDTEAPTKFGFVVSKKYSKRAVKRNRIKRLMREVTRLTIKSESLGNISKYMSVIMLPKEAAIGITYLQAQESFIKLLERIK